ncbi:MAG TPA: phosphoribosylformylglycinamidine synthase subunit PurL [Vicinamibacterales bacterium]|nr:phosphoribosylformylglycinamidine synthase subunit PurL [Vicinamibacterales bacterium]
MTYDVAILERHGLTRDEYARITELLGREPNLTELGMFSVMWSEHCSYKSSRVHLRTLPTEGPRVVQGPGENAGAVDIGDGLAAVFKIESHNHPSFIEPYQGAATGVGGIIRDIFTMGARPIALLDSLRFGSIDDPRNRRILSGVVAGIGGYGNSIGIPTVGGEVVFDETYGGNPLVNVFCLGVARRDAIVRGRASGVGNAVYYVGAKTGRDGIHGATMASAEFDEKSAEKRPAVQVGDPFMEKLLLEACLEVMKSDAVIGVQDMGAAGLTCSTSETGTRGGVGIEIDIAQVPQRETGMTPYEILLSESQERMLLIVKRGREAEVEKIFEKWDLHAVRIGQVTGDGMLRVRDRETIVAEVPNRALTDEAPVYRRPMAPPANLDELRQLPDDVRQPLSRPNDALMALLASPTVASKRWIYEQYDYMVRTNTIVPAGLGAGVVRVKGTNRALAMSLDGNGRFCLLDPRQGTRLALAEAARNVACAGAMPIGATNCLNFGNPERPDIMWQFAEAVAGLGEACRALEIPVTGGNVSLYNETDGRAILPTPVIGVVGLLQDASKVIGRVFPGEGLEIVLLGEGVGELGGSEYFKTLHGVIRGVPPALDLARERALQRVLVDLIGRGLIKSAHDCAEGGFAVALAECCFDAGGLGAVTTLPGVVSSDGTDSLAATLFGESPTRVIVSTPAEDLSTVIAAAGRAGVPAVRIGKTGGHAIRIAVDEKVAVDVGVTEAEARWGAVLANWLDGRAA